ncbi:MAG TPA: branched-chain amino acid ABC transporter permease [Pseudonocardiaceae bacterium]|jgi:branched-chain amino acid transport system permease protein|nr:branched-chain amino acid ABC transporter permease [Pseudonocardiaceae bacterium]
MTAWYFQHLTLIQGMLISIPLTLSVQISLRSGVFSFAGIGFYGIGAYGTGILTIRGWPTVPAMLLLIAGSGALAYLISAPLIRLRGLYLGMVTFAFDLILTVVATNGGTLTGGALGLPSVPLGVTTGGLLLAAVIVVVLVSQLERRAVGRSLAGIRVSDELAISVGIDVRRRKRIVFAVSAALGALAGSLFVSAFSTVSPQTAGFSLIITTLSTAVIGGTSSWVGAVIGTVIITWLPTVVSGIGKYQQLVYGAVLVVVVMFAPEGVLGLLRDGWHALRDAVSRRRAPAVTAEPDRPPPPEETMLARDGAERGAR